MASLPVDTLKQIGTIWKRLSAPGRIAVAATMILAVGGLAAVTLWARNPSLVVLESGLDPTRSSKITEALKDEGIDFETRDGIRTVLVPSQDVSRARLLLAGQNLIAAPGVVDEEESSPWDDNDARQARRIRRLQAELVRTISSFEGVESATIIISPGRDSPYGNQRRSPTASVHVKASPGRVLGPLQVQGIVSTVTRAVTGMTEDGVTVTGADGRPLTRPRTGEELFAGGDPMSLRSSFEQKLEDKVRSHLDRVVGPGHHTVTVSVEMNFDSTQTTIKSYDEEGRVLQSRDTMKKSTPQDVGIPDGDAAGADFEVPNAKEETKKEEYLVPETLTTEKKQTPEIKRISASVYVDENTFQGKLADLEEVLAGALGIDEDRKDRLSVQAVPFAEIEFPDVAQETAGFQMDGVLDILQYAAAGLVGLGLLMFFRGVLRSRPGTSVPATVGSQLDLTVDDDDLPEEKVSPKVLERRKLKKEIKRAIDQDPRGVAKLVEMWLDEEGA